MASEPGVEPLAAALLAFAAASGALRLVLLLDRSDERAPLVLDCAEGRVEVAEGAAGIAGAPGTILGEDAVAVAPAFAVPEVEPVDPMEIDPASGQVRARVGRLEAIAGAVRDLAEAFGGRSVVTAEYETTDPATPLAIAARRGEPLLIVLGERQFEAEPGWPEP